MPGSTGKGSLPMGNAKKGSAAPRRAAQHRTSTGRHRQPAPTVAELTDLPTTAGVKIAAAGIVGTSAALAGPVAGLAGVADAAVATQATAQTPGNAIVFQNASAVS